MREIHTLAPQAPTSPVFYGVVGGLVLLFGLGCLEGGVGAGGLSNVNGTIQGESFQMYSGVAEQNGMAGYAITITDASTYGCMSTPNERYLQVTWGAGAEGQSSAAGNVTFSSVDMNLSPSEPATSGSVTIDLIDPAQGIISGSIDAQGADSSVSGSFELEICP
jgi:hypothetical protein